MIDLLAPKSVQVLVDYAMGYGPTLWVHVDGVCILRITHMPDDTTVEDRRMDINYNDNN